MFPVLFGNIFWFCCDGNKVHRTREYDHFQFTFCAECYGSSYFWVGVYSTTQYTKCSGPCVLIFSLSFSMLLNISPSRNLKSQEITYTLPSFSPKLKKVHQHNRQIIIENSHGLCYIFVFPGFPLSYEIKSYVTFKICT